MSEPIVRTCSSCSSISDVAFAVQERQAAPALRYGTRAALLSGESPGGRGRCEENRDCVQVRLPCCWPCASAVRKGMAGATASVFGARRRLGIRYRAAVR